MSRRIAFWVLAAAAVLTAAPAHADRECFENSCRMPDVIEPPPNAPPLPALPDLDEPHKAEANAAPEAAVAAPAKGPVRAPSAAGGIFPQMIVDEAPRKPKPAPRRSAEPAPARAPSGRYDGSPVPAPAPVAAAAPVEAPLPPQPPLRQPRVRPKSVAAPVYAAPVYEQAPRAPRAAVIGVPAEVYADDGVVAAYPDPSWKLCQIDERGTGQVRYYRCGPYSYHPYGAHGYRPMGDYRAYRSTPAYVVAPNAKIISIEND